MKAQKLIIYAPVSGQTVALEQVPDPIFSQKMMGEGIAIVPENGEIVSPVDGEITMIARVARSRRRSRLCSSTTSPDRFSG